MSESERDPIARLAKRAAGVGSLYFEEGVGDAILILAGEAAFERFESLLAAAQNALSPSADGGDGGREE